MVSVLSALYTDQALKVPSLTRLEDQLANGGSAPRGLQTKFWEA